MLGKKRNVLIPSDLKNQIVGIQFYAGSGEDMRRLSHMEIVNHSLYNREQRPISYGVLDERLGVSSKKSFCATCGKRTQECVGHYGYIKLELPCFHVEYIKEVYKILQKICKNCSKVLIPTHHKLRFMEYFRKTRNLHERKLINERLLMECKKVSICPHCGKRNGAIKRHGAFKITHELYRLKTKDMKDFLEDYKKTFLEAIKRNQDVKTFLARSQHDLNPLVVYGLLQNIPYEDMYLLDMDPRLHKPHHLLWTHVLVPPCCIRPTVPTLRGHNEDDLSVILTYIIQQNNRIKKAISDGEKVEDVLDFYDMLHLNLAQFINSDLPGFSAHQRSSSKPFRSLVQRLKGKPGRFRQNLSGKRADFTGRSVISPDPNIDIDEVGMPLYMAKMFSFPERVTKFNKKRLQKAVKNGVEKHPGAYFVTFNNGVKKSLIHMNGKSRNQVARDLRIGNIVERHMINGDLVLFNRQPSLHRISIMCHRVKVLPYKTLRLNLCVCNPYNADFDGDEMNIHFPQTLEAKAEASELMSVKHNLCTPRNGGIIVTAIQDFITGVYLLTIKDKFLTRAEFCQIICWSGIESEVTLPPPCILYPLELWTGKQVLRVLIDPCPGKKMMEKILVNWEGTGKNYDRKKKLQIMDPNDSYIIIKNSELMCGTLDKNIVGGGRSLFFFLLKDYGADICTQVMSRVAKLCSRFLGNTGFSIGLDDILPKKSLENFRDGLIEKEMVGYKSLLEEFLSGLLSPDPGCTDEETLEARLNKNFSDIRSNSGTKCFANLPILNSLAVMARSGSKGSINNISQMTCLVGQQSVNGKRIANGFHNRTLPHFFPEERSPASKGFVQNSFFTGMNAYEFFFHTMAGREGLTDTAVKTSKTGYMQRKLMKALEDLYVCYDQTVRNCEKTVIQFQYGDDGLDPLQMEGDDSRPVDFDKEIKNCRGKGDQGMELFKKLFDSKNLDDWKELVTPSEMFEVTERFLEMDFEKWNKIQSKRAIEELEDDGEEEEEEEETLKKMKDEEGFLNIEEEKWKYCLFSEKFHEELRDYMKTYSVNYLAEYNRIVDEHYSANVTTSILRNHYMSLKKGELCQFLKLCKEKYEKSEVESGEAVGAIATQSVGEPGTQMTLKTFHFAGVASMNVTLGVPRILEIINANKNIKTPFITGEMDLSNEVAQNIVKGKIERTTLEEICEKIEVVINRHEIAIFLKINVSLIQELMLDTSLNFEKIQRAISHFVKIIKPEMISKLGFDDADFLDMCDVDINDKVKMLDDDVSWGIKILVPQTLFVVSSSMIKGKRKAKKDYIEQYYYTTQNLIESLKKDVIVSGLKSVKRAVVKYNDKSKKLEVLAEGSGFSEVMNIPGIVARETTTNHILEIEEVLGIEAARLKIKNEIQYTMKAHGMALDERHLKLLSDLMTFKGMVLGFNRHGIISVKNSPMLNASFERTQDHLFNAAIHTYHDPLDGVSENIIIGNPIPLGTGKMIDILYDSSFNNVKKKKLLGTLLVVVEREIPIYYSFLAFRRYDQFHTCSTLS